LVSRTPDGTRVEILELLAPRLALGADLLALGAAVLLPYVAAALGVEGRLGAEALLGAGLPAGAEEMLGAALLGADGVLGAGRLLVGAGAASPLPDACARATGGCEATAANPSTSRPSITATSTTSLVPAFLVAAWSGPVSVRFIAASFVSRGLLRPGL
jgi:hypothetical protein